MFPPKLNWKTLANLNIQTMELELSSYQIFRWIWVLEISNKRVNKMSVACTTVGIFCVIQANRGESEASAKRGLRARRRALKNSASPFAFASLSRLFAWNTQKIPPVLQARCQKRTELDKCVEDQKFIIQESQHNLHYVPGKLNMAWTERLQRPRRNPLKFTRNKNIPGFWKIFIGKYDNRSWRTLSIRAFSADGHYGLIVSLRRWTLSRHVSDLNQ